MEATPGEAVSALEHLESGAGRILVNRSPLDILHLTLVLLPYPFPFAHLLARFLADPRPDGPVAHTLDGIESNRGNFLLAGGLFTACTGFLAGRRRRGALVRRR